MVRPIIKSVRSVLDDGTIEWRLDGKLHRIDGPAIIHPNGYEAWYFMGKLHREDGPAHEWHDGYQAWYQAWYRFGKFHREDGPALIRPNRISEFYLEGEFIPEREYLTMNASKYPKLQVYQIIHA